MMICTFYSYKGGVGRTMALANIAELCYQAGLKVLVVDWDLEAPGLERFFSIQSEEIATKPGLIDMLLEYKEKMTQKPSRSESENEDATLPFATITPFITDLSSKPPTRGRLLLLPAGRRSNEQFAEYANAILTFNWQDFYENWEGELFFEWLRSQWKKELEPDIVLIDSRTGVTEMGGICTYQLADVVVMLTATNNQNLEGTDLMAREFTRPVVKTHRNGRPLEVIVVPARLEPSEGDKLNKFKEDFYRITDHISKITGSVIKKEIMWDLGIPYVPFYAFEERIAARELDTAIAESMVESFKKLARVIARIAPKESALKRVFGSDYTFDAFYAPLIPYPYDVYLSFDPKDSPWVRNWLIPNLEKSGIKIGTKHELFDVGRSVSSNLRGAITGSRYTLLILTPSWISNIWPEFETLFTDHIERETMLRQIIPVMHRHCTLPPPLSRLATADFTNEAIREDQFDQLLDALRGKRRLPETVNIGPKISNLDWGDAPEIDTFFGRAKELAQLQRWILEDHCRLVSILGMGGIGKTRLSVKLGKGGIGKTDLSLKLARGIQDQFKYVIWRRLLNAPKLIDVLAELIKFLSDQQEVELPETVEGQVSRLLFYLRQYPCLLIFDNVESILEGGQQVGQYREGYEDYGLLFGQIAQVPHQSCLLLTSREKPRDIAKLESRTGPIRSLELGGLDQVTSRRIFSTIGDFKGSEEDWQELIEFYNGNPLALELAARHIMAVFSGDIASFLKERKQIFADLRDLLDWYFARLGDPEITIMYWLAINREPVSLSELKEDILSPNAKETLPSTLELLQRLIPLERSAYRFTLQPVLIEYMTEQLVEQVKIEIEKESIDLFNSYALIKAQAKDHVRESQVRLILQPAIKPFLSSLGREELVRKLKHLISQLRKSPHKHLGYAAGNILNCLVQINADIHGTDFSDLAVWQAYAREANLINVNFANSDLSKSVFTDNFGSILSVAFSPDGTKLAAGTDTGEIRVWQAIDGTPLLSLSGHTDWVWGLAFNPDGSLLASGSSDQTIRLWDITNEQCLHVLKGHSHRIRSVAFCPDGTMLASASEDHTIRIWKVDSGGLLHTLEGHTNPVRAIAFSPDGKKLVSGSDDQTIRVWDVSKEACVGILLGHTSQIWSLAMSCDGKTIASGSDDRTVRIWDIITGECLKIMRGHTNWICSLAFNPNGDKLASGSADGTVRLWKVNTGQPFETLQGHKNWVNSVSFSPDGTTLASGSHDQTVRIWEVDKGHCLITLQGYSTSVRSVVVNPQGHLIASGDRAVHLWDAQSGHNVANLQGHTTWIRALAFSPDGTLLASGSDDQTARIWNVQRAQQLQIFQGHTNRVKSIAFSPDASLLVTGSDDHTVRLWDIRLGKALKILRGHTNRIRSVAFSPLGNVFASGSDDKTACIWYPQADQAIYTLEGHTNRVWSIAFSPDGQLLSTGSEDSTIRLWDVSTGYCQFVLQGHTNPVWSIAISPDGRLLASSSEDRTVRLWEVRSGKCLYTLSGHAKPIWAIAFSSENTMLASGSHDHTIRLWDTRSGEELAILQGHTEPIWSLTFSPDTKILVSSSDDGTCRLWNLSTKACQNVLKSERPYERMNITGTTGLTESQKSILRSLGAIEKFGSNNVGTINL